MVKLTVLAVAAVVLPGATLCSPASDEQETGIVIARGAPVSANPTTDSMRGIVASIDQRDDTIAIQVAPGKTEPFRVQDGLLFDSVRYGDHVEITVQNIAGAKTIVGLRKE
ncbi:hypothetical protein IVB30_03765 [Bradyrhizobium sp. 200]|uniref:hypothetical protein n=1 Tax=Bradyrhizobium sp. 200 TaxID=2782665 RepID=UPI0020001AE5|nr:hypothetical protein [Bradyrhizobium sp. 200]UPJ50533.1 hypothetical protein IVB30_03765 [Bradyrhizobium sp. 200]